MSEPKLRFKADDGSDFPEWTDYKADQLFDNIVDKDHPFETVLTIVQGTGTVPRSESGRNIQYDAEYLSNYKRVQKNDFIIHLRSFEGGLEMANEDGIVSPAYTILRSKFEIAPPFYYAYFHTNSFIHHNLAKAVEGIRDGRQISYGAFKELNIPCCSLQEQNKIAELLTALNKTIEQTQSEIDAWEKQKRGVMQLLFSRKVRFKADVGSEFPEWKELSFAEAFTGLNNNTFSRECLNEEEGNYKDIHYGDVLIKYGPVLDMNIENVPFINNEVDCSKYTFLKDGDIIIADTAEDETVGKATEIQNIGKNSVISGLHTMAWRPKEQFAPMYLGYYINSSSYHDQLRPYMQGIKVTSISKANIMLTTILYPCITEQQKIAACLSGFDDVINKAKQELDAYRQLKKGLLQQMFV